MATARATVISAGQPLYRKIARYKPETMKMGKAKQIERPIATKAFPERDANSPSLRK